MSEPNVVDWTVRELFAPIQIVPGLSVCLNDVAPPEDGSAVIFIDRGESFGTGGHPATQAIIWQFITVFKWVTPENEHLLNGKRLLEYNCGTGVLSLIAHCFLPMLEIVAVAAAPDQDIASRNVSANGAENKIAVRSMNSFRTQNARKRNRGTFDYVLTQAADPAVGLMASMMNSGATLLYGGHNAQIHHMMKNRILEFLDVVNVNDMVGWPVIQAEKTK